MTRNGQELPPFLSLEMSMLLIITVLCLFYQLFNSFYEYLSETCLITKCQSELRPKHSCETALNKLIDRWLKHIDEGKLTGVLFIDLSN